MSEPAKRGRKPNTPSLEAVVKAVERGEYDDTFNLILASIEARRENLKAQVLERVHQVFGPDAEVISKSSGPAADVRAAGGNLFERKSSGGPAPAPEGNGEPEDPLSHLDDIESRMAQEDGAPVPVMQGTTVNTDIPIEQRGAIIGGMRSSDMGN